MDSNEQQDAVMPNRMWNRQRVEVEGFGHYAFHGFEEGRMLYDWPRLWGVASMSEHSIFYNATLVSAFASEDEAREHAVELTEANENPDVNEMEYILHGPLGTQGMTGFRTFDDGLVHELRQYQIELAMATLMCTEKAFQCLPSNVRRKIYGLAYTSRANFGMEFKPLRADAHRILVNTFCRPDEAFEAPSRWLMDVPSDATINDVNRFIHHRICVEDERRPAGGRALHDSPNIYIGPSKPGKYAKGATKYIQGVHLFENYIDELEVKDGMPCLYVLMRPQELPIDYW